MNASVISCTKQRKVIWFCSSDAFYVCISDKEQRFVWKENVKIEFENRRNFDIDKYIHEEIVNPPQWVKDMITHYPIYIIEEEDIKSISINQDYAIVCGRLCLSSKTQWGITNKGLRKYSFIPMFSNGNYPMYIVASRMKPACMDVYVRVEISRWESNDRHPTGNLIETYGSVSDIQNYEDVILHSHQIIPRQKKQIYRRVLDYINTNKDFQVDEDWTKEVITMSIDPEGCLDIDDVLSTRTINDQVEFAVHIATPNIWLESEELESISKQQSTSVYTDEKTYHLLPELLATDYASLLPNKHRYCLSVIWTSSNEFRIVRTEIINKCATSYESAVKLNEYDMLVQNMKKIWGEAVPYESHEMVEFAMIKANTAVAEFLVKSQGERSILRKTINKSAYYLPFSNTMSNSHNNLSLKLYTHFTSPIRRYSDQLVHKHLLNILENKKNQIEIKAQDYIHMNYMNMQAKHIESQNRWISIIRNIKNPNKVVDISGKILSINDDFAYVEIENYTAYIRMIPYELKDIISINHIDDILVVKCRETELKYDISMDFNVKMYWIDTLGIDGLRFEWLNPHISKFIKCCL